LVKFAIVGAGAIGAYLGARLSVAGHEVYLIARGPHLRAMQVGGVKVNSPEGDFEARPVATGDYHEIGVVDCVFLTLKAHSLPEVAPRLSPLLGPETAVVSAQNGIPWWYFQRHGGPLDGARLESLDPGGVISSTVSSERIIGCIVYPSAVIVEPGVVRHIEGDRFALGELDGPTTERCRRLARAIMASGLRSPIRSGIRTDLWVKLLGNVAFNPISALTRTTLVEIATDPRSSALARAIMSEAESVAAALGIKIPISIDMRMAGAEKVGRHKTSMLQDLEAGRPMELDSIVGAVIELGEQLGVPTPNTRAVYASARLLVEGGPGSVASLPAAQ
jgi:2-dehydropantoate 2-reductase